MRVHYAALNNFDLETSRGDRNKAIAKAAKRSPILSGIEMAGVAESNGVRTKRGDRVFGYTNIFKGPWFHAQCVAVAERRLARVPESFSLEGAASVVGGALTTITAIERIAKHRTTIKEHTRAPATPHCPKDGVAAALQTDVKVGTDFFRKFGHHVDQFPRYLGGFDT